MASEDDLVVRIVGDTTKLQEAAKRGKDELDAFKRSSKEAAKVIESIQTPQDKFAATQAKLNKLLMNGHLTQDQYSAAMKKARGELEKSTTATDKMGDSSSKTFGADAVGRLGKFATGIGLITAAVAASSEAFKALKKDAQDSLNSLKGMDSQKAALASVATSPEDLAQMNRQADAAAMRFGISRGQARELRFGARSENFEDEFGEVARASQLMGAEGASTVAGQFRGLFPDRELTAKQSLSGVMTAAEFSRINPAEMARAIPQAAESASMAGTSPEELLASMGVLAGKFKSGDTAAERLKTFQSVIARDERTRGKGVLGAFEVLQGLDDDVTTKDKLADISEREKAARESASKMKKEGILSTDSINAKLQKQLDELKAEKDAAEKNSISSILGQNDSALAVFSALKGGDAKKIKERTAQVARDFSMTQQGMGTLDQKQMIQETDATFQLRTNQQRRENEKLIANDEAAKRELAIEAAESASRVRAREDGIFNVYDANMNRTIPLTGGVTVKQAMGFETRAANEGVAFAEKLAEVTAKEFDAQRRLLEKQLEIQQAQLEEQRNQRPAPVVGGVD